MLAFEEALLKCGFAPFNDQAVVALSELWPE
jgi:hypothetical protein